MAGAQIIARPETTSPDGLVKLTATYEAEDPNVRRRAFEWTVEAGRVDPPSSDSPNARWYPPSGPPGSYSISVRITEYGDGGVKLRERTGDTSVTVTAVAGMAASAAAERAAGDPPYREATAADPGLRAEMREGGEITRGGDREAPRRGPTGSPDDPVSVRLHRTGRVRTRDQILWTVIRNGTKRMGFDHYADVMDDLLASAVGQPGPSQRTSSSGGDGELGKLKNQIDQLQRLSTFYNPYEFLKLATEAFVMLECRVQNPDDLDIDVAEEEGRLEEGLPNKLDPIWKGKHGYLEDVKLDGDQAKVLPYLAIIQRRLPEVPLPDGQGDLPSLFAGVRHKLQYPCMLELIWSYWHEEGGLCQTMNHISQRFQNVRANGRPDPLANLELDPLMPLNSLFWGYVQDDLSRTSVIRRAHEYAHVYGFTLQGKALSGMRIAERRTKFLESFHNLLSQCVRFFRQDDNTTVVADGFPVLNAMKETHYLLAQGASNQFGALTSVSRQEMLLQQWLLARPEMREFLGGRVMVPYPEPWMDRVDTMKTLQGWTDVSVVHFHDLATFGEQLLLSIRYGAWSTASDANQAANWARYWRSEIQGYIHAYRAVTGVDLTADLSDPQLLAERYTPPSRLLQSRLANQRGRRV